MGVSDGVVIVEGKGQFSPTFRGEFEASLCNQWGLLMHSCAKVRKPIDLSFGVMSEVGLGLRVLDVVQVPLRKGRFRGILLPLL